ncbi:MAG: S41 family peptidase [Pseudomonadota bacterium]
MRLRACLIRIPKFFTVKRIFTAMICVVFFTLFIRGPWCSAQDRDAFKPLFPVDIRHEFPKPGDTFDSVKDLILGNYYSDDITEKALYWAAIQGMLRYISPPDNRDLAKIWTPEEYEQILQALKGVELSIGIQSNFNPNDGSLTVTGVSSDSPADTILKPFDRIMRIDSFPLKGKSISELNALLKGKEGTEVTLTVNRDIEVFDVTLKRETFETKTLIVSRLTDSIALVEIKSFTAHLSDKLGDELAQLRNDGFKGLIVDLRNNNGGVLNDALRTVELFLPKNQVILRTLQRKTGLKNYISSNDSPSEFDMAILVNHHTASSAEILTSALQDHNRALIVGAQTFGKGVFEQTFTLKNDFRVKFITGAMYSPKGKTWQGKGITPDFLVEQSDETLASLLKMDVKDRFRNDVAMITAYKLLLNRP